MAVVILVVMIPAYLGPGGALSTIGSFLALLGAVLLALVGFLWYPLKRFRQWIRERRKAAGAGTPGRLREEDAGG